MLSAEPDGDHNPSQNQEADTSPAETPRRPDGIPLSISIWDDVISLLLYFSLVCLVYNECLSFFFFFFAKRAF